MACLEKYKTLTFIALLSLFFLMNTAPEGPSFTPASQLQRVWSAAPSPLRPFYLELWNK